MDEHDRQRRALEARVTALTRRVARLEQRKAPPAPRGAAAEPLGGDLVLLEQLRRREGSRYRAKGLRGAVAYGGAVQFGEREYLWAREHAAPELATLDLARVGQALATLGHPARLLLVRAILQQARTSHELQAVLGVRSPGQLYHHLKELLAAGIVTQTARSQYEVEARQVVPVLAVLAAAADLAHATSALPVPSQTSSSKE